MEYVFLLYPRNVSSRSSFSFSFSFLKSENIKKRTCFFFPLEFENGQPQLNYILIWFIDSDFYFISTFFQVADHALLT